MAGEGHPITAAPKSRRPGRPDRRDEDAFFREGKRGVLPIASATYGSFGSPTDRPAGACQPDPNDGSGRDHGERECPRTRGHIGVGHRHRCAGPERPRRPPCTRLKAGLRLSQSSASDSMGRNRRKPSLRLPVSGSATWLVADPIHVPESDLAQKLRRGRAATTRRR
jgi:hypothetical protein